MTSIRDVLTPLGQAAMDVAEMSGMLKDSREEETKYLIILTATKLIQESDTLVACSMLEELRQEDRNDYFFPVAIMSHAEYANALMSKEGLMTFQIGLNLVAVINFASATADAIRDLKQVAAKVLAISSPVMTVNLDPGDEQDPDEEKEIPF